MGLKRVLIANRSEIACRLQRTYQLFPIDSKTPAIETVAIYTPSEHNALHVLQADHTHNLGKEGPRAYLDAQALVDIAKKYECWGLAPGYGFLSEDGTLSQLCHDNGIVFLGPTPDQLWSLGDKVSARSIARSLGIPILEGTSADRRQNPNESLEEIQRFASSMPSGSKLMIKAAAGGGGRGIRVVDILGNRAETERAVQQAFDSCSREAKSGFGDDTVYAERFLVNARHVEVQILGDGQGDVTHFWDRECSLQRRNQKVIEIAPAPELSPQLRQGMLEASVSMARSVNLRSLTTFEFLVDPSTNTFYFMEANPRIQVEHTITESVTGVDLVALQLQIGLGKTLAQLGLDHQSLPFPSTTSIQMRVNSESFNADGTAQPELGTIASLYFPSGNHVRIDTAIHPPLPEPTGSYKVSPLFDNLLAKVIITAPSYTSALQLAKRSLAETQIEGVHTNIPFLLALLNHDAVKTASHHIHTVQADFTALLTASQNFEHTQRKSPNQSARTEESSASSPAKIEAPAGSEAVISPLTGAIIKISVVKGATVRAGQELAVIEAMKMEHVVRAAHAGTIAALTVKAGGVITANDPLMYLTKSSDCVDQADTQAATVETEDYKAVRPELEELQIRRQFVADEGRTVEVKKRHDRGYRTARENIRMLIDSDSFLEYGDLNLAAQASRYSHDELIRKTSGDGIVTGWAQINGHSVALAVGDYMVLAGTQGYFHHLKLDRIFLSIMENPAPLILYAEGGGGRPGDTDIPLAAGLQTPSFALLGELRARGIPSIGVANGYVFAGNAALLGTCDLVVATRGGESSSSQGTTSIGMGGKAMVEGGGLGVFESEEIGPPNVHMRTGAIDVLVENETKAADVARCLFGMFAQPSLSDRDWIYSKDTGLLRTCIPSAKDRKRTFDMRRVIQLIVDDDSFIELAPEWGTSMITGFGRVKGKAIAILASDPGSSLGGAIDVPSALKAMRLMKLLTRTRAMHLLTLCDTPGFMVGPAFEKEAGGGGSFRVFGEWFSAAADLSLSGGRVIGLVVRRAFGLGAQAMLGGGTLRNSVSASWPQGSFGAMGLEGAIKLGMKKRLEAIKDPKERQSVETALVDQLYERGKGLNMATKGEIDTVIDPAETRDWIGKVLHVVGERLPVYKQMKNTSRL